MNLILWLVVAAGGFLLLMPDQKKKALANTKQGSVTFGPITQLPTSSLPMIFGHGPNTFNGASSSSQGVDIPGLSQNGSVPAASAQSSDGFTPGYSGTDMDFLGNALSPPPKDSVSLFSKAPDVAADGTPSLLAALPSSDATSDGSDLAVGPSGLNGGMSGW